MCHENPLWRAPRIRAELALLGHDVAESTVARYMARPSRPRSPTWKTFLANHAREIAAADFFVVPTATFRLLHCFLVLSHDRRCVLHFSVTSHPTSAWTAQQLVEAFPFQSPAPFLLHDRDSIYGNAFKERVKSLGMEEVIIAAQSPWQNPFVERLIGSIRRERLDHVIVLSEAHLKRILCSYFA
jgi:putative transposase